MLFFLLDSVMMRLLNMSLRECNAQIITTILKILASWSITKCGTQCAVLCTFAIPRTFSIALRVSKCSCMSSICKRKCFGPLQDYYIKEEETYNFDDFILHFKLDPVEHLVCSFWAALFSLKEELEKKKLVHMWACSPNMKFQDMPNLGQSTLQWANPICNSAPLDPINVEL